MNPETSNVLISHFTIHYCISWQVKSIICPLGLLILELHLHASGLLDTRSPGTEASLRICSKMRCSSCEAIGTLSGDKVKVKISIFVAGWCTGALLVITLISRNQPWMDPYAEYSWRKIWGDPLVRISFSLCISFLSLLWHVQVRRRQYWHSVFLIARPKQKLQMFFSDDQDWKSAEFSGMLLFFLLVIWWKICI